MGVAVTGTDAGRAVAGKCILAAVRTSEAALAKQARRALGFHERLQG